MEARDLPGMADVDSSLLLFCRQIKPHATVALSGECADEIFGGYPWYRDPAVREKYGFPWAQSTAYRAAFIKDGVLGDIDPAAFVDARYQQTLAETSVLPGRDAVETRMRQMVNLSFAWFMEALEALLASGADNPVPWYGQLMTTPQTIAWFLQVNYWMKKYRVELV